MVFSSMMFIWVFLPVTISLYYLFPPKYRNILLLLASLIFYAWGEPTYILLMLLSIAVNWLLGILIEKEPVKKSFLLAVAVILNLGILGYYKYSNFLFSILSVILKIPVKQRDLPLPIGISFFTFQILSYIIDLYRGRYKAQKNIFHLALYISFFPQLIAGPIVKYIDINDQLQNRTLSVEKFAAGVRRFLYGLGKKVILANSLAVVVDKVYLLEPSQLTGSLAWIASVFYTLQIYYDFSGYSDMAIGLGKMFGFDFHENFLYPYSAVSIQDFWRKWHISLSSWFKEYLYIPLGGSRRGAFRTYLNLMIVFLVTGLWHGAGFTFIAWGIYHGIFSVAERLFLGRILKKSSMIGRIYSLMIINAGWVLFRADNLHQAFSFIKRMLLPWRYTVSEIPWQSIVSNSSIVFAVLGTLGCGAVPLLTGQRRVLSKFRFSLPELVFCLLIFILSVSMLAGNSYNPFIYFRF